MMARMISRVKASVNSIFERERPNSIFERERPNSIFERERDD